MNEPVNENTQKNPEELAQQANEEKVKKVNETIAKMRELGIDPNGFVTLFVPILEQMNREAVSAIRNEMQTSIERQAELIGQKIVSTINTEADRKVVSMNQSPPVADPFHPPQPAPAVEAVTNQPANNQRGGLNMDAILPLLLKYMAPGGGTGGDMGNSLKSMAETAKLFGSFYTEMMQPLVDIQAKMRQNVLAEMTTYSKTGGVLPWEREEPPAPKVASTVSLNQGDRSKAISDLAKRIRLV